MAPEILRALSEAPLLRGLSPAEIEGLGVRGSIVDYAKDEALLVQGRLNDKLLVIVDGRVEFVREHGNSSERVARAGPGTCLGEMSALTGHPVALTARAATPVRALAIDKEVALQVLETVPRIGGNLAGILIEHLQGHLGRRQARTTLLVLDDLAGDEEVEATRALVTGVAKYSRRTVVADLTDLLRLARARGLPTLAELDADPRHSATIERELYSSIGVFWTLRRGATELEPPRLLRALRLLDQYCDQLMVLAYAQDADALAGNSYFHRTVWIAHDADRAAPAALRPVASELEPDKPAEPLRRLVIEGERPSKMGASKALDARAGARTYVAGGEAIDPHGTLALARDLSGQRVGLVLGAGATRGFAHIGVLDTLKDLGLPIDAMLGSSAGSGIGAAWSFGYSADHIAGKFGELQRHAAKWTVPTRSILSGKALFTHIANVAGGNGFEDSRWPLGVIGVDLYAASERMFTSGDLARCVLASCAIPGIYPPVDIEGRWYVDGGVLHPLPTSFAKPLGADVVVAVDLAASNPAESSPRPGSPSLLAVLRQSAELMHARITHHSRGAADIIIRPRCEGPPPSVTDYAGARAWREHGRVAAEAAVPELRALLPWFR